MSTANSPSGSYSPAADGVEPRPADERPQPDGDRHRALFMQAPAAIAVIRGPTHIFELANPLYERIVGRKQEELLGKPGREAIPELAEQGVWDLFDRMYASGKPFVSNEFSAHIDRLNNGRMEEGFFNFVGKPTRDAAGNVDGIFIHAVEVTELVRARQRTEALAAELETERARLQFGQQAGKIGTFEWRFDTNELLWSPELEALFGYSPGEFGRTFAEWETCVHPDDLPRIREPLARSVREHAPLDIEYRIVRKDGSVAWIAAKGIVFDHDPGVPHHMTGINIDITERKQAENNLLFLSEASKVLSSSLDYATTLDTVAFLAVPHIADWCSVDMLDAAGELQQVVVAHKDPEKVQWAKELRRHNPPDMSAPHGIPEVLRTGKPELHPLITDELLVATARDEEELALARSIGFTSVIIVPILSAGTPVGAITLVTTESRRRYAEPDLAMAEELAGRASLAIENARLYEQAQEAIALRDEFISIASHELRTPVTSLKVYTQVLRKQAMRREDVATANQLTRMEVQVDKLTKLINDLLDVSKIQAGRLEYGNDLFDLDVLVREVAETAKSTDESHAVTVLSEGSTTIAGDRERIGQVITNLMSNAIKYSPKADRILVHITGDANRVTVAVRDFGIGIDPCHQEEIFERFFQVSDPHGRTFPGLGMGLYISREIARRHGGDIVVDSVKGEGATFSLILPVSP